MTAEEAVSRLKEGNSQYIASGRYEGDISQEIRVRTTDEGQKPYAIIVGCSDSRVIPEVIFHAGIGELFVIRVAGNVIDSHQLGSIEYAADHLGTRLIVVLGHEHCGAINAAIHHDPDGHIRHITDEICKAIGGEQDENRACRLNIMHSMEKIESNLDIQNMERYEGLKVVGAVYHTDTGEVEFLQ